jgi:hypothetical protein
MDLDLVQAVIIEPTKDLLPIPCHGGQLEPCGENLGLIAPITQDAASNPHSQSPPSS